MFQIQDAENDPLTRTAALCSLVSTLMSLSFGIVYIVRFDNMCSMYRASRWAEVRLTHPSTLHSTPTHLCQQEAQKTETAIFWNIWVLLALPGIWLAWSVLAFIVAIMSFVWRTGASGETHASISPRAELGLRIGITCQFVLGLVYFVLVIRTFRNYGEVGRKARVVQRLADVTVELETRRDRDRDDGRARAPPADAEDTTRGRSRAGGGGGNVEEKTRAQTGRNELGLSGMDRKQEATVTVANVSDPAHDSYSSLGM